MLLGCTKLFMLSWSHAWNRNNVDQIVLFLLFFPFCFSCADFRNKIKQCFFSFLFPVSVGEIQHKRNRSEIVLYLLYFCFICGQPYIFGSCVQMFSVYLLSVMFLWELPMIDVQIIDVFMSIVQICAINSKWLCR